MERSDNFESVFKVVRTLLYYDSTEERWTPRVSTLSTSTVAAIVAGAGDMEYDGALALLEEKKERPYD